MSGVRPSPTDALMRASKSEQLSLEPLVLDRVLLWYEKSHVIDDVAGSLSPEWLPRLVQRSRYYMTSQPSSISITPTPLSHAQRGWSVLSDLVFLKDGHVVSKKSKHTTDIYCFSIPSFTQVALIMKKRHCRVGYERTIRHRFIHPVARFNTTGSLFRGNIWVQTPDSPDGTKLLSNQREIGSKRQTPFSDVKSLHTHTQVKTHTQT